MKAMPQPNVLQLRLSMWLGLCLFACARARGSSSGSISSGAGAGVTPLGKAIEMLSGVKQKAELEKHEETVQYGAYEQFCSDVTLEKQQSIAAADEQAEKLAADVQKFDTRAAGLASEIDVHHKEIAGWAADASNAAEARAVEQAEYASMRQNYTESVEALAGAMRVLKAQQLSHPGTYAGPPAAASALMEVRKALRAGATAQGKHLQVRSAVTALLERRASEEPDDLTFQPPVTPYEFRSGDIVKLLEDLHQKFQDELTELEKAEVDRSHAFTMFKQNCEKSITAAEGQIAEKQKSIAKYKQQSVVAAEDLQMVQTTRSDDAKYLADLTATCKQKAAEYEDRQTVRTEEIQALEKALELLKSEDVSGAAEAHLPAALAQLARGAALAQLRSGQGPIQGLAQTRVAEFLRDASSRLRSPEISALAMAAQEDPLGKVKTLIEELIQRLMAQAVRETEHKGWCDTELATNAQTRKTKTEEIDTLSAEIESLEADADQLAKEVAELQAEVEQIEAAVENATELREAEHNESLTVVADAQKAQVAVGQAIQLLQDFYAAAAERKTVNASAAKSSLLLQSTQEPPPIFSSDPYKGQQSTSGGVIGILQVIQSDFARLESDTQAAESRAQQEYDQFMEDSAISKAQKESDIKHKAQDQKLKAGALPERRHDLKKAQELLQAAEESYEKLRPTCIAEPMSWEERNSAREQEIEALKQALDILTEATP